MGVRHQVVYWAWLALRTAARLLPDWAADVLAPAIAAGVVAAWPRGRRAMLRNFARVLPEAGRAERLRLVWRSLANYLRYLVTFARIGDLPAEELARRVEDGGNVERLKRHLATGRGAVLALPHFGNWDLGAAALRAAGVPLLVIAERFGDARVDREVFGRRREIGLEIAPLGGPMSSVVRRLKGGGVVALLVDRPLPAGGVPVRFFGQWTSVPDGAARLVRMTGAKLIPVATPMVARDRVRIEACFDLDLPPESDPSSLTQAMMNALERFIRRHPDQWYMFRDFWPEAGGR